MQGGEDAVDDTCLLKQCLPCQGTKQEVHPHGQDKDQYQKRVLVDIHVTQDHGKGICQKQADHSADHG